MQLPEIHVKRLGVAKENGIVQETSDQLEEPEVVAKQVYYLCRLYRSRL